MRTGNPTGWIALALAAGAACAAEPAPALQVRVAARAIAAGEPMRVIVTPSVALAALEGRFLEESFPLEPQAAATGAVAQWIGWTMVPLSRAGGPATIDLAGTTTGGAAVTAQHAFDIADKAFPEERLTVAPSYVEPPPEVLARIAEERELLAALYRARGPSLLAPGPFVRPVPGEQTAIFGTRRVFNGQSRDPHGGLDLRAATGSTVRAAGRGRVVLARDLYYAGNTVLIDHGGGLFTVYSHLSEFRVAEGDLAEPGQVIALSGATGRVTGPHLHWGAKIGNRAFDPTALLDPVLWQADAPSP